MHPCGHQLVFQRAAHRRVIGLRNRNRGAVGIVQAEELVLRGKLDGLTEKLGGFINSNGFHIGQKAIADGLKLFRAYCRCVFVFHATELGGIAKISRGYPAPVLAKGLILASIAPKA